MNDPIRVDIPHKLGRDGAKAKIAGGLGKLAGFVPGGTVTDHRWEGDTLFFTVQAMGQRVASKVRVDEAAVHAELDLPPFLRLFADKIRDKLSRGGPKLLE